MIYQIFKNQTKSITKAAFILALASFASRLLGLIRDHLLASTFGAGSDLDAYYAAFRIPDLVYNLVILGALSAGFIPIFTDYLKNRSSEKALYFANQVLNLILIIVVVICLILFFVIPYLIPLIVPGFSSDKISLTVRLTRIMLLSPLFLGVSALFGGILQSLKNFLVYSLAPIFYNLGIIFGILFFTDRWGVFGLAWSVVLGAFLHLLLQSSASFLLGFRYRWLIAIKEEGIIRLFKLMVPRVLSLAVTQINILLLTVIASTLVIGSLAVYNLAFNIYTFPLGIFALSFVVASFPNLSEHAVKKNWLKFSQKFSLACRQILFLIIPASIFLYLLKGQLVRVILGAGKFSESDIYLTAQVLQWLSLGLFAESLIFLLTRVFFALEDSLTPFFIGLAGTALRVLGALILVKKFQVSGLAMGYSFGGFLYLFLLWFFLSRKFNQIDNKISVLGGVDIFSFIVKIIFISFIAGLVCHLTLDFMKYFVNLRTNLGVFWQGLTGGLLAIITYLALSYLFNRRILFSFLPRIRAK